MEVKIASQESFEKANLDFSEEKLKSPELTNGLKVEKISTYSNFFTAAERVPFPAPVNGDVDTEQFLAAGDDYVTFFYTFGIFLQLLVVEARDHIKNIRNFYEKNKEERKTIGKLLASLGPNDAHVGFALLWLRRGLEFYHALLAELHTNACRPPHERKEINALAPAVYERTLKKHHGFLSSKISQLMMKSLPSRASVVKTLCNNAAVDEVVLFRDAAAHIRHLPQVIQVIDDSFVRLNIDTSLKG